MSRKSEIMNEEILFSGKRIDNGEWVEGLPYKAKYGGISAIVNENEERFVIIPETLRRYIGLTDKNGKRIYKADIIRYLDRDKFEWKGVVIYFKENASYLLKIITCMGSFFVEFIHIDIIKQLEVIGNIHDNPELLE